MQTVGKGHGPAPLQALSLPHSILQTPSDALARLQCGWLCVHLLPLCGPHLARTKV